MTSAFLMSLAKTLGKKCFTYTAEISNLPPITASCLEKEIATDLPEEAPIIQIMLF